MRTCACVIAVMCLLAGSVLAEDKPNPDQLKKAYDDALVQLKAAQNSKNELARQNEKLMKEAEDSKKQLAALQAQTDDLKRQVSDNDQKTFALRSCMAAWHAFLKTHPGMRVQWEAFLGHDVLALPHEPIPLIDPNWPFTEDQNQTVRG